MKRKFTDTPFVFNGYTDCIYAHSHTTVLVLKATPFVLISDIDRYTVCIPSIYTTGLNQFWGRPSPESGQLHVVQFHNHRSKLC